MADEKDAPAPQEPAPPGAETAASGATPTRPPDTAAAHPAGSAAGSTPPLPTPPMTPPTGAGGVQAAPAPRSNAASGVADPAPPRPEGVSTAEPTVPADAKAPEPRPVPPRPTSPAAAAAAAPAAVHTKGPSDAAIPGGPNPVAQAAARAAAATTPPPARAAAPAPAATPAAKAPAAKPADAEGVSRRGFLKWTTVGWVAFSAACTSSLVATARFLFPNVLFEPPQAFKAGFPSEYTVGEVDTRWKDSFGVWIVRNSDGFYALIAVCTHLGCSPNWLAAENKFKCPCHGSGFYKTGVNFEGPAPRPLERARIVLADDGQILVDKSVKFQQEKGEWSADDSFLKV
jgi:cytochrome b6-f complex iron-sulfur subunit